MKVGYRGVSSVDQSLDRQDLGDCERIFEESSVVVQQVACIVGYDSICAFW